MRKAKDYGNGKIYEIVCNVTGLRYVGHTTQRLLSQRMSKHRASYKRFLSGKSNQYCTSYEVLKHNNYYINLLESYPCNNEDELTARERYYVETLEQVNQRIPNRSQQERYEVNKKAYSQQNKLYREENKEVIQHRKKVYYDNHREYIIQREKNRYETNKEVISQRAKERYQRNKEVISQLRKEKYTCGCGSTICKGEKSAHERSQKHQAWVATTSLS